MRSITPKMTDNWTVIKSIEVLDVCALHYFTHHIIRSEYHIIPSHLHWCSNSICLPNRTPLYNILVNYIYIYIYWINFPPVCCSVTSKGHRTIIWTKHTDAIWSRGHSGFRFTIIFIWLFTNQSSVREGIVVFVFGQLMALQRAAIFCAYYTKLT